MVCHPNGRFLPDHPARDDHRVVDEWMDRHPGALVNTAAGEPTGGRRQPGGTPTAETEHTPDPPGVPSGPRILRLVLALLVVNPQASTTTAGGRDVLAHALASECKLHVAHTTHRGHATELAASAASSGADLVIAHGGDGTVNEVVNGLLADGCAATPAARPALGVVPGGSANVFARALGIPPDPVEATHLLLQAVEAGRGSLVGLGRIDGDGRWFTFNAGLGWDGDVVARVEAVRRKSTSQSLYARLALDSYLHRIRHAERLTVELPATGRSYEVRTAFVSNTDPWTYLGTRPIHLNPGCSFDTGLGLFALSSMSAPNVLRHLAQAMRSTANPRGRGLVREDDAPLVRVRSVNPAPFQVDGDHIGERTRVEFMAVPEALRVVA